jgi:hypothetical protein
VLAGGAQLRELAAAGAASQAGIDKLTDALTQVVEDLRSDGFTSGSARIIAEIRFACGTGG